MAQFCVTWSCSVHIHDRRWARTQTRAHTFAFFSKFPENTHIFNIVLYAELAAVAAAASAAVSTHTRFFTCGRSFFTTLITTGLLEIPSALVATQTYKPAFAKLTFTMMRLLPWTCGRGGGKNFALICRLKGRQETRTRAWASALSVWGEWVWENANISSAFSLAAHVNADCNPGTRRVWEKNYKFHALETIQKQ